jgi:hypothetical protein
VAFDVYRLKPAGVAIGLGQALGVEAVPAGRSVHLITPSSQRRPRARKSSNSARSFPAAASAKSEPAIYQTGRPALAVIPQSLDNTLGGSILLAIAPAIVVSLGVAAEGLAGKPRTALGSCG